MESLRGQLLIASPALVDPNFHRTVVLVAEHTEDGAMGLVLNRPAENLVADAVPPLADVVAADDVVYVGGPVQPAAVVVLAEFDDPEAAAVIVFGAVGFLPGEDDIEEAAGATRRMRVFAGYAGWGAGQLEAEIAEPSWILEDARPDDVFAEPRVDLWSAVLRRKGPRYRLLASMPVDPSVN